MDEHHRLKIADFGIAKLICSNFPDYHTAVGTMLYMAPEVYLHLPYDKSVDTWGLGMIFYELAMNKYPFTQAVSIFNHTQHWKSFNYINF